MPSAGFEPTISAGERPQTYALDRAATGTGEYCRIASQNAEIASLNAQANLHINNQEYKVDLKGFSI
jgi:hypothetical protein